MMLIKQLHSEVLVSAAIGGQGLVACLNLKTKFMSHVSVHCTLQCLTSLSEFWRERMSFVSISFNVLCCHYFWTIYADCQNFP